MRFTIENVRYEYDLKKDTLKALPRGRNNDDTGATPPPAQGGRGGFRGQGQGQRSADFRNYSPDKKAYVYALDHNLYYVAVVDAKEGEPIQLSKDGEKDHSFGSRSEQTEQQQEQTQTEGQTRSQEKRVRANATWSKDSKRFFITRSDSRKVKDLFLVNSLAEPRPTLLTYKYDMPGEADVAQTELFVFEPDKKEIRLIDAGRYKDQRISNIHWPETSDRLRFVRRDRLQRNLEFCELNVSYAKPNVIFSESVENAYLEVQSVRYVKPDGDFIWFSERNGWGHYYLYDFSGKLKNPITTGPFRASQIVDVDAEKEVVWFRGNGREANENPYYSHLYRIKLDGTGLTLLDSGEADHDTVLSPSKKFLVDTYSRTDLPAKIVLRDSEGKLLMDLEDMDVARLREFGWRLPETFKVKSADGVTDIYGNMWKPTDFDPKKQYPIIANVYPGPQTESVSETFTASTTNQRLAQLGFIVIQIGNRGGNPARSNAYHSYGYYNLRDYGLADKKAGIEELAARYPWIDIDRVGIFGHSGGGFMTAAALLLPPYNEFFKVGVSSSGNHDNNVYNANWSEQHHGLKEVPVKDKNGKDTGETKFEIKVPTNAELAANLKGKLLLVHGDMDNNVHPAGTIRLVNALIKANKRFDLMIMPGQAHGYGTMQPYFTQMLMEYFAEHLLGDNYRPSSDMNDKSGG